MHWASSSAVRARVCEELAPNVGMSARKSELFFLGSLSLIETILDRPMADILADLPLAPDVEDALMGKTNPLRQVLDLVVAYERGAWTDFESLCTTLGVDHGTACRAYRDGLTWAQAVCTG